MSTHTQHGGWDLIESGPPSADHSVLLIPGTLGTAAFFEELMAEPKVADSSVRLVATTLPGYGGTSRLRDSSIDSYAEAASNLAADIGCDAVLGHSTGANVAIEMAASAAFTGPLCLLSPSFSRKDEPRFPRAVDHLSSVLGQLPWTGTLKVIGSALKADVSPERHAALVAEMKKTDPHFLRRQYRSYLRYLDRYGSLVPRLCESGAEAWVAFGESDDVGLADRERRELGDCPRVTLATIPGAGHLTINEKPAEIADLVLEMVSATAPRTRRAPRRGAGAPPDPSVPGPAHVVVIQRPSDMPLRRPQPLSNGGAEWF